MRQVSSAQGWCIWGLVLLAFLILLPGVQSGVAQEPPPPEVAGIKPNEGGPGEQIQVTIWGNDFDEEAEVIIEGVGAEVMDRSSRSLVVQLFIPGDAPPGPRDVIVINHVGPAREGMLPGGFIVLGSGQEPGPVERPATEEPPDEPGPRERPWPPEPSDERDGDLPWGILGLLVGALVLLGVPVAVYLSWDAFRRRRLLRQREALERWQGEAQRELPRECQPGAMLPIIGRKVKPGTWEIVHLIFTAQVPVAKGQAYDDQHFVGGKIVRRLNEIIALRKRTANEERLRRMVSPLAEELARLVWVWTRKDLRDRQVTVQATVEGQVAYQFKLYECQKTDEGNRWQEKKDWEGTIKETQEMPAGQLVSPQERESKSQFQRRAAEALIDPLLKLTSEVSSMG